VSIPTLAIFNAANGALRSALYKADREMFGAAEADVAIAGAFVRLLQTYNPPHGKADPPQTNMKHSRDSLSGVTAMFHYQVKRWDIDVMKIDDGLFVRTETS
jgi:hypothetical protein